MAQITPDIGTFIDRTVGSISGNFIVRSYQRGYRWGSTEVNHLLTDILNSKGETYYLQPIVVKQDINGKWELIDGQQRLTTLLLIFQYLRSQVLPNLEVPYALEYETRPHSADFLNNPTAELSSQNVDFFFMHQAWTCIFEWFDSLGTDKTMIVLDIYSYLYKSVKVIWFEAPESVSSSELFTRLNVGKIPLTDSELVKALVLAHDVTIDSTSNRAQAIAAEWDTIERDLRNPELWASFTGKAEQSPTHIGLLLDLLARNSNEEIKTPFRTFETLRGEIVRSPHQFWDKVVDLHSTIVGWYEDRDLFHKIGYLVASQVEFQEIFELSVGKKKSEFITSLDNKIRLSLRLDLEKFNELSYDEPQHIKGLFSALLLMNVETIRKLHHSTERYSFHAHASGRWSLEHIHAQNAEELHTIKQWESWLQLHRKALSLLPTSNTDQSITLAREIDAALESPDELTHERFRRLESALAPFFDSDSLANSETSLHHISNLALLDSGDNSALSNSWFEVKRLEVLRRDREGSFIPPATRNVFLKYYTEETSQQLHYWGSEDRQGYIQAILNEIAPYLTKEATV